MNRFERGLATIELIAAIGLIALIGSATVTTTFQTFRAAERGSDYMITVQQLRNASNWISKDARMAENIITDSLPGNDFIVFAWTKQPYGTGELTYHTITYSLVDKVGHAAKLKRNHWSSGGINTNSLIATCIYINTGDPANNSVVSYASGVFSLKLTAQSGDAMETKEYTVMTRPQM